MKSVGVQFSSRAQSCMKTVLLCCLSLCKKNININCVSPGFIKTDMTDKISEEFKKTLIRKNIRYLNDLLFRIRKGKTDFIKVHFVI